MNGLGYTTSNTTVVSSHDAYLFTHFLSQTITDDDATGFFRLSLC